MPAQIRDRPQRAVCGYANDAVEFFFALELLDRQNFDRRGFLLRLYIGGGSKPGKVDLTAHERVDALLIIPDDAHPDLDGFAETRTGHLLHEIERWTKLFDHSRRLVRRVDAKGKTNVCARSGEGERSYKRDRKD